jgi:hypothetical protein
MLAEEVFVAVDEGVDRGVDGRVVRDVGTVVVWLFEELFEVTRLVDDVVLVAIPVSIQEHALMIFEGDALQSELIATGVAMAMFVV